MKKIKKVLAVLLTLAMVMAMSLTAFADVKSRATITVSNADKASLSYVQVIVPDRTTETGWAFAENMLQYYQKADAFGEMEAQEIIKALISYVKDPVTNAQVGAKNAKALSYVAGNATFTSMSNPQEVASAGIYAIKAVEANYTYNNMSAYIGFGEVVINETAYEYPSLVDATINAKKTSTDVQKEVSDSDKVVEIGDVVTYTVKVNVPYINPNDVNKYFGVYDKLTGAEYQGITGEGKTATVTMAGAPIKAEFVLNESDESYGFTLDLSELINTENTNAGKEILVTYNAVITEVSTNNTAGSNVGGSEKDSNPVNTYSGEIVLTKYASDDDNEKKLTDNEKLAGATYVVYKVENEVKYYALFDDDNEFVRWSTAVDDATPVTTGEDGTLTVKGLDIGTYYFKEIIAPKGYSVNTTDVSATLELAEGTTQATAKIEAGTHMIDTKLSALPSTGGMGTTLFTIGGCIIMILAAALFFVNRRRSAE